jgi:ribose-phosphate pyrophosphokinase
MAATMTAPVKPVRALFTDFKVFSGTANPHLTAGICQALDCSMGEAMIKRFADGETHLQIQENVRGTDVFVVQPTCTPVNEHLMELLLMIDAFKRASAERITAVLPYYGYARQDRKDRPRMPISAKLVASLLERAGASRVLAVDLHAAQIQGFFDIPVDHLFSAPVMLEYFENRFPRGELIIVSPDAGGVERARSFAKRLNTPLAIIDKRRTDANVAEVMNTRVKGVEAMMSQGAKTVRACATHAVLSGPAVERLRSSELLELVVTDTIPLSEAAAQCEKIKVLSVASLLGRAIQSIHEGGSISTLFV